MFGSFLNVFLNSIVMLLYYQYYYSVSFISFVILSFPCFIILALIALSEFLCVLASFSIFSDVGLLCYLLWTIFLYVISFLSHRFIRRFKAVYTHIWQHVLCWLTLDDSMLFYCFNHYFNDIPMVILLGH